MRGGFLYAISQLVWIPFFDTFNSFLSMSRALLKCVSHVLDKVKAKHLPGCGREPPVCFCFPFVKTFEIASMLKVLRSSNKQITSYQLFLGGHGTANCSNSQFTPPVALPIGVAIRNKNPPTQHFSVKPDTSLQCRASRILFFKIIPLYSHGVRSDAFKRRRDGDREIIPRMFSAFR